MVQECTNGRGGGEKEGRRPTRPIVVLYPLHLTAVNKRPDRNGRKREETAGGNKGRGGVNVRGQGNLYINNIQEIEVLTCSHSVTSHEHVYYCIRSSINACGGEIEVGVTNKNVNV